MTTQSQARHTLLGRVSQVLSWPLIALVWVYQWTISPMLGPTCKFYPSCSAYAVDALKAHGVFRGTWLTGRRLLRCHPWSDGGVDHVPASGRKAAP